MVLYRFKSLVIKMFSVEDCAATRCESLSFRLIRMGWCAASRKCRSVWKVCLKYRGHGRYVGIHLGETIKTIKLLFCLVDFEHLSVRVSSVYVMPSQI